MNYHVMRFLKGLAFIAIMIILLFVMGLPTILVFYTGNSAWFWLFTIHVFMIAYFLGTEFEENDMSS